MSSTTNIPINTRSMNGIITISDGIATMENGNLTNVDSLDANTTNSTTMTTTTQPPGTNNTTVATTAFVNNNLLDYVTLDTVQTITANKTFTGTITRNNTTFDYSDYRFVSILGGGESTQMYQTGGGLTITSITNNKFIAINTKDISGNSVNGLVCRDGNQAYLQGALNNRIDITGTQATIGGTSVPIITTQPLTTSNNNEIATTAFVKNQGYALLNSNNTFTGINTFNTNAVRFNAGFVQNDIGGGSNSTSMYQSGASCSITNNFNNGSIRLWTRTNSGVSQDGVYALGGARAGLQGDSGNTIEIFGTQATIGGTSVPKITTQPLTTSNTNEIASTAYVKSNLLDYVTLSTNQTITANKIFNGTTTLNNFFVNNFVDLTLTTYENQFYGDIYGYRGVVCQDGFYVKDSPALGANTYALIDTSGNISTTTTIAATGNISSSSEISCTGVLSSDTGLNIPSTSPVLTIDSGGIITQTSTGINNLFNTTFTSTDNQIRIKAFANTAPSTISQAGSTLQISAITNNTGATLTTITLATRSSTNGGVVILNGNANNITIGANTTNTNISSTNIVCSGITSFTNTTTPTITQAILLTDNSTKIATTAFVKGQGYALLAPTTQTFTGNNNFPTQLTSDNSTLAATTAFVKNQGYALLTANQTFTGGNTFTNTVPSAPIAIKNTTSSSTGILVISGAWSYNGINSVDDYSVVATGTTVNTGVLTLTTYATGYCGIRIDNSTIKFNAPLTCNYYTLPTVPTLNIYDIGFTWYILGTSFTAWTGFTTPQNVATINFDGTGSRQKGVWQVDIVLCTQCTSAPGSILVWTTASATSGDLTPTCTHSDTAAVFGAIGVQIMRLSFVLNVTTIPSTYYLNYSRVAGFGAGLASNTANSRIAFTRIG